MPQAFPPNNAEISSIPVSATDSMDFEENSDESRALARLTGFLENKEVLGFRTELHEDATSSVTSLVATIKREPEQLTPLTPEQIDGLAHNAAMAVQFIQDFSGRDIGDDWHLDDLDVAFRAWLGASDRQGCTEEAAIAILGAAFGQYCIAHLGMAWTHVSDADGDAIAICAKSHQVRAYPFDMVSKRIEASEHSFFARVYLVLQDAMASGDYAPRD